jgi:hypothetical protein
MQGKVVVKTSIIDLVWSVCNKWFAKGISGQQDLFEWYLLLAKNTCKASYHHLFY